MRGVKLTLLMYIFIYILIIILIFLLFVDARAAPVSTLLPCRCRARSELATLVSLFRCVLFARFFFFLNTKRQSVEWRPLWYRLQGCKTNYTAANTEGSIYRSAFCVCSVCFVRLFVAGFLGWRPQMGALRPLVVPPDYFNVTVGPSYVGVFSSSAIHVQY